ncbi:MAG: nickel pincer cofactor biosynthesis protein LarC [Deltaproteobacteria bacterium]|nr:nickel pincer cofactor biosynthesis protein LarC [Deltaproteobacteria bacterium]
MKIAYFDCFAGASGDMILGALVDAGLDPDLLNRELANLHLDHFALSFKPVVKRGLGGSQAVVDIDTHMHHPHRGLRDIRSLIEASTLSLDIRQKSMAIFTRLAEAEARVHRTTVEAVHFHEVGAIDAIIDVVGAVSGLSLLGIEAIHCSALHLGSGTVTCAHGILPVPAPATLELVKGIPVYATEIQGELLTPTGAAILTTLARGFGPLPAMTAEKSGYGAGMADPEIPNLLRVVIGNTGADAPGCEADQVAVLETAIDDMNPQIYDYVMQQALGLGALDIFLQPVQMKKNRPGVLLTLMCRPEDLHRFSRFLLEETTSIGLRWRFENRIKAGREIREISTSLGTVRIKTARIQDDIIHQSPEFEDCKKIALARKIPLKAVIARVSREISSPNKIDSSKPNDTHETILL